MLFCQQEWLLGWKMGRQEDKSYNIIWSDNLRRQVSGSLKEYLPITVITLCEPVLLSTKNKTLPTICLIRSHPERLLVASLSRFCCALFRLHENTRTDQEWHLTLRLFGIRRTRLSIRLTYILRLDTWNDSSNDNIM